MTDQVDRAFYELTVKQRDAAWLEIEQLKARLALLEARHEREKLDAEILYDSMRHLPLDQRVEHANRQMDRVAEVFGFAAVVTLTPFDAPELLLAFRTPSCSDKCEDPRQCDVDILGAAGRFLQDTSERIGTGSMEGVDLKSIKKDLPQ